MPINVFLRPYILLFKLGRVIPIGGEHKASEETMNKSATLLDRTFDEGVALTLEARNYIAFHEQADRREYDLARCLHVGYQHTRVSARLIQVMTWLLAMKALLAGEISPDQFGAPQYAMTVT